jgi:transcription elongation factor GreA
MKKLKEKLDNISKIRNKVKYKINMPYYSVDFLQKMKNELILLKTKKRLEISKDLQEAASKGDLKENAEYHAAKEAKKFLEIKIAQLEKEVSTAKVIKKNNLAANTTISLLNKVKVKELETEKRNIYTIVSSKEASLINNKLSISSPIGKALVGKKVGDQVEVHAPRGTFILQIEEIS